MAAHSRFTDDVWCTPAPSGPKIPVRTADELKNEIFRPEYDEFRQALFQAEEMKSKDLYENYPPNFRDKNKQYIFKYINERKAYSPAIDKSLLVTRWKPFLPTRTPDNISRTSPIIKFVADVFKYETCGDDNSVQWYLNFANHDLFAYYSGPLLAQDELQVLECTELASLREYFVQTISTLSSYTTGSDKSTHKTVPTPILISNAERIIEIDTSKVYGNAFAKATERQLIQACKYISNPQTVNLIAIEAPSRGERTYTLEQVQYILTTAYVGFKAAQILADKTHKLNKTKQGNATSGRAPATRGRNPILRTIIHTGWWGCGAYGNNRVMMILAQLLAAYWSQIDEIIFHVQTTAHDNDTKRAGELFEKFRSEKDIDHVVEQIYKLNLQWDKSNDT